MLDQETLNTYFIFFLPPLMDSSVASLSSDTSKTRPFRFFDLPSELRIKIYQHVLYIEHGNLTLDLDYYNDRRVAPRLTCFRASRRMHDEAYPIFYGSPQQPIRLFPTGDYMYRYKKTLLERLPQTYRAVINTLELRLGPGWDRVPKSWRTGPSLGLVDCTSLRYLKIVVQIDPTDKAFEGHRGKGNDINTYKDLCLQWLQDILTDTPSVHKVQIDAYPGVEVDSLLVQALASVVVHFQKKLSWGPERIKKLELEQKRQVRLTCGMGQLEEALATVVIGEQRSPYGF